MESENDTGTDAPEQLVTVNQIVAWNIAWFRHEARLTQAELAGRLGWPQNKVSEAERSWSGKRTREFDAHTLIALSLALRVPVNAFFLPPLDDGTDVTYLIRPAGQPDLDMGDLVYASLPAGSAGAGETDESILAAYRDRLVNAIGRYAGGDWASEAASWFVRLFGAEVLPELVFRLRAQRSALLASAGELEMMAGAFEKAAEEEQ
jgi:transcriptional regulator with XRE-family HTH domain